MGKFKFEKYDYAKIGIKKKFHLRQVLGRTHYQALGNIFHCYGRDLAETLVGHLKESYKNLSENGTKISDYDVSCDWEWEIITPEGTYKSNETSS